MSAEFDFGEAAARLEATVHSHEVDGSGWRWRVTWHSIDAAAWNDMDGVAVIADIGPDGQWVGLALRPPDPTDVEALEWLVATLSGRG